MSLHKTLMIFVVFPIFLVAAGISGPAYASSKHIGLRGGYSDYTIDKEGFNSSHSTYGGLMGGIRKGPFEFELSGEITRFTQTSVRIFTVGSGGFSVGDIFIMEVDQTMLRLMLSGKYHFLGEESLWGPYLGIGGGGYIPLRNDSEVPDQVTLTSGGPVTIQTDIEIKNIFGAQFSAGTDFRFKPNLALGFEFRSFLLRSDFEADSGRAKITDPTRITIFEYGMSLKYYFPN